MPCFDDNSLHNRWLISLILRRHEITYGLREDITMTLETQIDKKIGEVRTEALDLSFGEIANLHASKELIIHPAYQRLFRWSTQQKSRLIESILLELPVPQIFVIENADGVYELIDGLQRISTVLQFFDSSKIELEPLFLNGCDIIDALNGKRFDDLPLSLRLRIKRSTLRTIVIKRQSKSFLRYEMFKRLNTGGSILAPQEIRNCSSRMLGAHGAEFYSFLQELSEYPSFKATTNTLSESDLEQKGNEELVLRFFAAKNYQDNYRGNIRDWLDDYMEAILLERVTFDTTRERSEFQDTFDLIQKNLGETAFVKFRGTTPIGGLAPAYYEAVAIGSYLKREVLRSNGSGVKDRLVALVQTADFRAVTGPGANNKTKLMRRIELVSTHIDQA
jgi:hypothetical protein